MKQADRIQLFVESMWEWYAVHKRDLPWRDMPISDDTERAYRVLVSEVMLQQTQVSRVKIVFKNFLELFPSIHDLAAASNRDVLLAWRGMGYNSRALRLRNAAKAIVERVMVRRTHHDTLFPYSMEELLSIPGIGPYTAAAIRNFAFNIPTPCIDTNIRRILHRTFYGPESADGSWEVGDKELMKVAKEVLDVAVGMRGARGMRRDTANWHAALMDYGSLVQTKNNPKWEQCILTERGIMKTTSKKFMFRSSMARHAATEKRIEPGRFVGSKYIPNRIFRGRIVEALRDAHMGMEFEEIGRNVSIDWNKKEHEGWLKNLITKLVQEEMIARKGRKYVLAS